MRYLSTTLLLLFFFRVFAQDTGQSANTWIELAPTGEYFRLFMPRTPRQEPQRARYGELQVNGPWYTATADGASYAIWALHNENYQQNQDADAYLDACAELLWEALLQPARDKLPKDGRIRAAMTYVIYVVRKLPHGLTQSAIKAARSIRFSPALKDEQRVSMYMELQYNFNLF
jgi:hypothetical protein